MGKLKIGITDILLLLVSLIFLLGMIFAFYPCAPKDDGSFMSCHWAGNTVTGLAAVLTVISGAHMFVPDRGIKTGLSCSAIPVSVLAMLIPGNIIDMCMMDSMRCHAVMKPAVIVLGVLVIVISLIDVIIIGRRNRNEV